MIKSCITAGILRLYFYAFSFLTILINPHFLLRHSQKIFNSNMLYCNINKDLMNIIVAIIKLGSRIVDVYMFKICLSQLALYLMKESHR